LSLGFLPAAVVGGGGSSRAVPSVWMGQKGPWTVGLCHRGDGSGERVLGSSDCATVAVDRAKGSLGRRVVPPWRRGVVSTRPRPTRFVSRGDFFLLPERGLLPGGGASQQHVSARGAVSLTTAVSKTRKATGWKEMRLTRALP